MVAGVEEPLVWPQRGKFAPADLEPGSRSIPQRVQVHAEAETAGCERAVQVEFDAFRVGDADALGEPAVEPRPGLRKAAGESVSPQETDRAVEVRWPDQQVEVSELAQRRVRVVEMRDGGPLEHPERKTVLAEDIRDPQQRRFQREDAGHHPHVEIHDLGGLGVGRRHEAVADGACKRRHDPLAASVEQQVAPRAVGHRPAARRRRATG